MKLTPIFSALLAFAAPLPLQAGLFPATGLPQSYSLPDGTTTLPDSSQIYATLNNGVFSSTLVSVQSNALKISTSTPPEGTINTASRLLLPVIDAGKIVTAFTFSFDLSLSAPTADPTLIGEGFSLNFGTIPGNAGTGETGFSGMANGLTIGWDTKDNGGQERALIVYANGSIVGDFPAADFPGAFIIDDTSAGPATFRPVVINWDPQGLDITWNGVVICENVSTPGFAPSISDRFAFATRTTSTGPGNMAQQDVSIDNVLVTTTAPDPLFTDGPVIWEFMARNKDDIEDDDFDHPDWIEIYNGQGAAVNLGGWYLTDDPANLQKWQFPSLAMTANGYTYVFASGKNRTALAAHFHTNFTLPGESGWIALVRPDGSIKSQVTYGAQYDDIPSGFKTAFDPLGYLSASSPGKANTVVPNTSIPITRAAKVTTEEPVFTDGANTPRESGFITANTSIVIKPPVTAGAVVRYTTNGSIPTETSTLYSAPIAVSARSMAVRARIFATGSIGGPVKSLSLIYRSADLTNYRNTGKPFTSNLPVLVLDSFGVAVDSATTQGARPSRYTYGMLFDPAQGSAPGVANLGDTPVIANTAGTHVRGQTSAGFPQRPYALEWWNSEDEDKDIAMVGMPADSDWVLYSPHNEETLMRNALVYTSMYQWAGQGAGMRNRFVEVFFNQASDGMSYADYKGVYLLVEKIKRGADRVNVEKLNGEVTNPALITGGYMWKKDKPPQVQTVSTSSSGPWGGQTWEVIEPNVMSTAQRSWLQTYVQQFDTALMNTSTWQDPVNGYRKYADTASFIDNMLWVEAFKQIDGYRISTYFGKTRTGKIRALPTWDYNLAAGNANYYGCENPAGWYYSHIGGDAFPYWPRLLQDPAYVREHWDRFWKARRSALTTANVHSLIDQFDLQLRGGDSRNVMNNSRPASPPASGPDFDTPAARQFAKWGTLGSYQWPNQNGYTQRNTFQSEIGFLKGWMKQRLEWMEFQSMDGSAGLVKMRPPNFHDRTTRFEVYRGRVAPGFQVDLADPDGIAGAVIYYTVNGPDPRQSNGATDGAALTLPGASTTITNLITNGASWRYFASLSAYPAAQAVPWTDPAYDDSAWTQSGAPFGYGESGLTTTLPAAVVPTAGANQVTCFRRSFEVADPANVYQLTLELNADDGAVVWINGQEATRVNMPYTPLATTFASRATGVRDGIANGEAENIFVAFKLDPSKLKQGTNSIAVEVHQFQYSLPDNPNNSPVNDMRFDLRLKASSVTWPSTPVTFPNPGIYTLKARTKNGTSWSPLSEAEFIVGTEPAGPANLVVSELHYNPSPPTAAETAASGANVANDFEYFEIMNISDAPVDLTGLAINDAVQFDFALVPAASRILAPRARALIVENRAAFLVRYPGRESQILGEFTGGNLKNSGEAFTLTTNGGASTVRTFAWGDSSPWPVLAAAARTAGGPDFSMVLTNPASNPDHSLASNWRSSGVAGGNPGNADSVPAPASATTDTDGDGITDFAEWAFGENGTASVSAEENASWPAGKYLVVRVPRSGLADAAISVEHSENLQTWGGDQYVDAGVAVENNREVLVFRSAQPIGTLQRLFVRAAARTIP